MLNSSEEIPGQNLGKDKSGEVSPGFGATFPWRYLLILEMAAERPEGMRL